jgi:hypothetical protein
MQMIQPQFHQTAQHSRAMERNAIQQQKSHIIKTRPKMHK